MVFVLSASNKKLMPTTEYRARRLIKSGKATIYKYHPFTVKLTTRKDGYTQPIEYCCDTGYQHIGISMKSYKHEYVNEQRDLLKDEPERHNDCRKYRSSRRNRKTRYRKARWNNRKDNLICKDGFAPSIRNKRDIHMNLYKMYYEVCPITSAVFEMGQFDTQILKAVEEGILLDNGYASSLMINDPKEQALILDTGYIFLTNHQIREEHLGENGAIRKLIESMTGMGMKNLVLMSQAFTDKAIEILAGISNNTPFRVYAINAPYVNQGQLLLDIEAVVGGKCILQDSGSLEDVSIKNLGMYSKLKMRIMGGVIAGKGEGKEARIAKLRKELEGEQSFFAKRQLEERIAALNGKLAFLKIGAYVKSDRERLKDKADDAVVSVRMAWKGGTVKGAGQAFHEIAEKMEDTAILKKALSTVYYQIKKTAPEDFVVEEWVRDPFLTLKAALKNACECAKSMSRIHGSGRIS